MRENKGQDHDLEELPRQFRGHDLIRNRQQRDI